MYLLKGVARKLFGNLAHPPFCEVLFSKPSRLVSGQNSVHHWDNKNVVMLPGGTVLALTESFKDSVHLFSLFLLIKEHAYVIVHCAIGNIFPN